MLDIAIRAQSVAKICGAALVNTALRRLLELELGRFDLAIQQAHQSLVPFEMKFSQDSIVAWKVWQSGGYAELADDADLMEWMALTENLQLLLAKRVKLVSSIQE